MSSLDSFPSSYLGLSHVPLPPALRQGASAEEIARVLYGKRGIPEDLDPDTVVLPTFQDIERFQDYYTRHLGLPRRIFRNALKDAVFSPQVEGLLEKKSPQNPKPLTTEQLGFVSFRRKHPQVALSPSSPATLAHEISHAMALHLATPPWPYRAPHALKKFLLTISERVANTFEDQETRLLDVFFSPKEREKAKKLFQSGEESFAYVDEYLASRPRRKWGTFLTAKSYYYDIHCARHPTEFYDDPFFQVLMLDYHFAVTNFHDSAMRKQARDFWRMRTHHDLARRYSLWQDYAKRQEWEHRYAELQVLREDLESLGIIK